MSTIANLTEQLCDAIASLPLAEKVTALNLIRRRLHEESPFRGEPVDCVVWVEGDSVVANDYNPNKVAPPEMELLYRSVRDNGFAMPLVTCVDGETDVVVDGFHRNRVGKEKKDIRRRLCGYLPVARLEKSMEQRMQATVQFNRARGEHAVDLMAGLITKLVGLGCGDVEIAKTLGMSGDELIRLKQQTGIAALFANQPFSRSWVSVDQGVGPDEGEEYDTEEA